MDVVFFGTVESKTILDGIIYFFHEGSHGIGLIIFTASILVPIFKIIGMILILLSIQFNWNRWLKHKTSMARFIHFIGRWSMLDMFVVSVMVAVLPLTSTPDSTMPRVPGARGCPTRSSVEDSIVTLAPVKAWTPVKKARNSTELRVTP